MSLDAIYHALDPIAFSVGPFSVRWYGIAYVMGFVLGAVVVWRTQRRWHLNLTIDDLLTLMIGIALGVIIGGRLGYCLFYGDGYYFAHPLHIFMTFEGGMSFHGGLIGGILGGWISCKFTGLSPRTMLDLGLMAAPLGLFFGRCANFVNGELWGKPTDLPWGVTFETGGGIARHPSQLYEALLEGVVIFIVLQLLSRKRPAPPQGLITGTFLVLYGVFRILIEFVRVPDIQLGYLVGFLTMGQLLSIPLILAGLIEIILALKRQWPQSGYVPGREPYEN